jgi:DNA-binding CsgD family transcriptional regulator
MTIDTPTRLRAYHLWMGGMNYAQIGKELGMSPPTAKRFVTAHPEYTGDRPPTLSKRTGGLNGPSLEMQEAVFDHWSKGHTQSWLAKTYGAAPATVNKILRRHPRYDEVLKERTAKGVHLLVANDVQGVNESLLEVANRRDAMLADHNTGMTLELLGRKYGVTRQRAHQILCRHPDYVSARERDRIDDQTRDEIFHLWRRGHSEKSLIKRFNTSLTYLKRALSSHPSYKAVKEVRTNYVDGVKAQKMVDMYNRGHTLLEVQKTFGNGHEYIGATWRILKSHPDYEPRGRGRRVS